MQIIIRALETPGRDFERLGNASKNGKKKIDQKFLIYFDPDFHLISKL